MCLRLQSARPIYLIILASLCLSSASCRPSGQGHSDLTCPDIAINGLTQPSGALSYTGVAPADGYSQYWSLLSKTHNERSYRVGYAPQGGWTMLPNTTGMGFDVVLDRTSDIVTPPSAVTKFLLEYEFPEYRCPVQINYGVRIHYAMPNGICLTEYFSNNCFDGDPISVTFNGLPTVSPWFDAIVLEDPQGIGSPGNFAAISLHASEIICGRISDIAEGTDETIEGTCLVEGEFTAVPGASAKLYVGASVLLQAGASLELGRRGREDDALSDEAFFQVVDRSSTPTGTISYIATAVD